MTGRRRTASTTYVGAMIGLGSPPFRDLDAVPDPSKLAFAGPDGAAGEIAPRACAASSSGLFGAKVEIDEFVGMRLMFEPADLHPRSAQRTAALGVDILVGGSVFSVQDKIRIRIYTRRT